MNVEKIGFKNYFINQINCKGINVYCSYLYYTKKEAVKLFRKKLKESEKRVPMTEEQYSEWKKSEDRLEEKLGFKLYDWQYNG